MSDAHHTTTRSIGVVLLWLCAVMTVAAAIIAATGGFAFQIAGMRVTMHTVMRPIVIALALGVTGTTALGMTAAREQFDRLPPAVSRYGLSIAILFAAAIGLGAFGSGAQIAGGADSSGYLSEARLWRSAGLWDIRRLRSVTPLAHQLTLTNRQYPFTPVGYQPAGVPASIVPGYPPGLPLHFAIALGIGGERAQFAVVPLCAAGLVIVAFLMGRRIGGPEAGLFAAVGAGASPILLYQATQPMSDVVAAFWWSLAILLLMRNTSRSAAAAGIAAAIAGVVRPNLFAMVPVVAILAWWWNGWRLRALVQIANFAAPLTVAAVAFALLQQTLYGDTARTGYGEISSLFSLDHVWPNLARYPRWAIFTQSGLILAALAAPIAIRRDWITPSIDRALAERLAWSGLLFFGCLQGFYLLYLSFDDWVYFRFLLPALPWVLVLQAVTIAAICRRVPAPARSLSLILVAVLMASWGVGRARAIGAFRLQDSEQRYLDVADFVRGLPPNAVFLSLQHSGSLAYYNAAAVLRWDWIEPDEIDRAVSELSSKRYTVYAVLDDWEEKQFRQRFAATHTEGQLRSPLFFAGGPPGIRTFVYAITGTTTLAAAAPVNWQPWLAPRTPRTPGAPAREPDPGKNSNR